MNAINPSPDTSLIAGSGFGLLGRLPDRTLMAILFALTFIIATLYAQTHLKMRVDEEPRVGAHIARGHGFRTSLDPSPTAEFTAWVPPGYPFVCAAVYKVFGVETEASMRALLEINAISLGLIVAGIFRLGQIMFARNVGLLTALSVAVHPLFLLRTNYFWHTYIVLAIFVWILVLSLRIQKSGASLTRVALLGAALGILMLFNASMLFAAPVIIYLAMRDCRLRKQLAGVGLSMAAFLLVIAPWSIRNSIQFDKLMYLRHGASLELWIGNLPGSNGWQELSKHPSVYPPEHDLMLKLGEEKYIELSRQRFEENHKDGKWPYYKRCLNRTWFLLVGPLPDSSVTLVRITGWGTYARIGHDLALLAIAIGGWFVAWRGGFRCLWMIPLAFACALPHILTHMSYRYAMPAKLFMLMMAAFLICSVLTRIRSGAWPKMVRV